MNSFLVMCRMKKCFGHVFYSENTSLKDHGPMGGQIREIFTLYLFQKKKKGKENENLLVKMGKQFKSLFVE